MNKLKWFLLFILFSVLTYNLLIPPIVGIANNGDFERIMNWGGLLYSSNNFDENYMNYVVRIFSYTPNPEGVFYLSTEALFVKLAVFLSHFFIKQPFFDIRVLGFVHLLFFMFALYLIISSVEKYGKMMMILVSTLLFIFFLDVGYSQYFNSFYSETSSLIFLLFSVGLILKMCNQEKPTLWMYLALTFSIIMLLGSKSHNVLLGFPIALFGIRVALKESVSFRKYAIVGMSLFILISSILLLQNATPKEYKGWNVYHSLFRGVLMDSNNPASDLAYFGLNPEYAKYKGSSVFDKDTPYNDINIRNEVIKKVTSVKVVEFFLTHPAHFIRTLDNTAKYAFVNQLNYLGNFEKMTEFPPKSLSQAYNFGETIHHVLPKKIWFILLFFLTYMAISIIEYIRKRDILREINILLPLAPLMLFSTTIIGDGYREVEKHLFLFNALFDLCICIAIVWVYIKIKYIVGKRLNS